MREVVVSAARVKQRTPSDVEATASWGILHEKNTLARRWPLVPLSALGEVLCGQSPPSSTVNRNALGTPYISGPEHWDGSTVHLDKWTTEPKRCVPAGCVFITVKGAGVGTVFPGVEAAIGRDIYAFKPNERVDSRFLEHALRHTAQRVIRSARGDIPGLSKSHLLDHEIILPPLDEQKRIVAEIEKQFTRLDAGVTALRRMQANLKRYRAAVLKAACESRLVPSEGKWNFLPLSELITNLGQGWSPKCDLNREPLPHEWAVITTTAVQPMRYIDNQGKPLPDTLKPRPHLEIAAGDMLMTRKGPRQRAGVACLVRATRPRMMVCDTVYRFRCREELVSSPFLEIALNSPSVVAEIDKRKAGINESGVSLTHEKLGSIAIPVPTPAEQTRIIAEVERRLSVIEELESVVNPNLQRTTRLRQSVLQRAFSGAL